MIAFVVATTPIGKARPRFARAGGFVRAYTPTKTIAFEATVAASARHAMGGRGPLAGPLSVEIRAAMPIPASWSAKRRAAAMDGLTLPTSKPDADNVAKAILDALNGICFADDAQVVTLTVRKAYGAAPGVGVVIEPVP